MPAALLGAVGFPLAETGQWYRFVALGSLGLWGVVGSARGAGVGIAACAVLVAVGHGAWSTGHELPRPAWTLTAYTELHAAASDARPGAVLMLPLLASTIEGGPGLAMATVHRRATTSLARHSEGHAATVALRALVQRAHSAHHPDAARRVLAEGGVALVVWRPGARVMRGEVWLTPDAVAEDLGPGVSVDGATLWWTQP